jgi:hypothetical protein
LPSEFEEIENKITNAKNEVYENKSLILEKTEEVNANAQIVAENTLKVMEKLDQITTSEATVSTKAQEVEHYYQFTKEQAQNVECHAANVTNSTQKVESLFNDLTEYTYAKSDLYSKQDTNNKFAYAFKGNNTGYSIELYDIQTPSNLISLVQKGETSLIHNETISPANPCDIQGIDNATLMVDAESYNISPQKKLYRLSNGISDTFDIISGEEIHYIEKAVLTTAATITYSTITLENALVFSILLPGQYTGIDRGYVSSHFTIGSNSSPNAIYNPQSNESVYFKVEDYSWFGITENDTTAQRHAKIRSWLGEQYNGGTPVTILYQLATPKIIKNATQIVPISQQHTSLTTNKGSIDIKYCKDSNHMMQELISAILILGGTI